MGLCEEEGGVVQETTLHLGGNVSFLALLKVLENVARDYLGS